MAGDRPSIRYGRIVFAWIEDRNGHGKLRPAIVISKDDEIDDDAPLVVMAITTTFSDPPPDGCISLPWHPRGNVATRLNARSAAMVNWLASIHPADVVGFGGDVPSKLMRRIHTHLDELET